MERCIVKVLNNSATGFPACFYNEGKVAEGTARFAGMRNFGLLEDYNVHFPVVMSRYLQKIADHNSRVKHPQKHIIWSFPGRATPEQEAQLLRDAAATFDLMGYKGQPQSFWVHYDTANTHIHGVTTTISVKNGCWIDDYREGRRARRILDRLRGVDVSSDLDKYLDYKFESHQQFVGLLLDAGYKCHHNEDTKSIDIFRNRELVSSISQDELDRRISLTGKNKDNYKDIVKKLRGVLLDRRRRSLKFKLGDDAVRVGTKNSKQHTVTKHLGEVHKGRFNGDKGIDLEGERKAQFKQFLIDLKREQGISIVFSQYQDGKTKGYTLIDHKNKLVFKGSDIADLQKLLNPDWRKGDLKNTVLSADDAASLADEIRMEKNMPQAIEQQLERLGVDIVWSRDTAFVLYRKDSETENRQKAVSLMEQVRDMVRNEEDVTVEGLSSIKNLAKEAMHRAVCADIQQEKREEQEKAQQEADRAIRLSNEENGWKRVNDANGITADMIGDFVMDFLVDYNIDYDHDISFNVVESIMTPQFATNQALQCLKGTVDNRNTPEEIHYWANRAVYYARCAEYLQQKKVESEKGSTSKQAEQNQLMPKAISFLDINARVINKNGLAYIVTRVGGEEKKKMLLPDHAALYRYNSDPQTAARQLALHYFSEEFYNDKREQYKQECINRYKMPYGIQVDNVRNYITVKLKYPNGDWDNNVRHTVYSDDYRPGETDEQLFIRKFGSEEADNYWNYSFQDLKDYFFPEQESFESDSAVSETLSCFNEIAASFNDSLASIFGAITGAMSVNVPLGGGGGGHNDLPKKKNDDDWMPRSLFGMKPKGRGLGLRR